MWRCARHSIRVTRYTHRITCYEDIETRKSIRLQRSIPCVDEPGRKVLNENVDPRQRYGRNTLSPPPNGVTVRVLLDISLERCDVVRQTASVWRSTSRVRPQIRRRKR